MLSMITGRKHQVFFELNRQEYRALLLRIIIINTIIDTSLAQSPRIHVSLVYAKCMQNCILTLDF